MKKTLRIAIIALIALFAASAIQAQEWTKDQQEVWKVVQDSWQAWKKGDMTAYSAILHDRYQGWGDDMPLPSGKQEVIDWYNGMKDNFKSFRYEIQPARILVLKGAAVVDYYYYYNLMMTMGDKEKSHEAHGKIVEFYVKEGGNWQLLGDMMVHQDKDDND